ncbi:MAG: aldo/keto reductase [Planctomycetes bacterium]|nr:aldo/keto reductase [Planctomycetota bacterium]
MQYRPLGNTGIDVSCISFGGIKLPNIAPEEAAHALNRALDLGMNFVDTARNYRDSETKIGNAISHRRAEFYLATKTTGRDAKSALSDLETSLRELKTEKIDLYQLHSVSDPDTWQQVMAKDGALEGLKKAQEQGKIDHISITCHRDLPTMCQAIKSGEFETIMVAYSPIDSENVAPEVLPLAKAKGMGVIVMKGLSGGQLCRPVPEGQERAGPDDIVRGALRCILGNGAISCVIPGMTCVREVEENAATGDMPPMTDEEKAELLKEIGSLGRSFRYGQVCLRCGYCQPCPQAIDIPAVFRAYDMAQSYPGNIKHLGREHYEALDPQPDVCEECGECMEKCPAGIDIPARLKQVREFFAQG